MWLCAHFFRSHACAVCIILNLHWNLMYVMLMAYQEHVSLSQINEHATHINRLFIIFRALSQTFYFPHSKYNVCKPQLPWKKNFGTHTHSHTYPQNPKCLVYSIVQRIFKVKFSKRFWYKFHYFWRADRKPAHIVSL